MKRVLILDSRADVSPELLFGINIHGQDLEYVHLITDDPAKGNALQNEGFVDRSSVGVADAMVARLLFYDPSMKDHYFDLVIIVDLFPYAHTDSQAVMEWNSLLDVCRPHLQPEASAIVIANRSLGDECTEMMPPEISLVSSSKEALSQIDLLFQTTEERLAA
jgi:hypothetical protein